MSHKFLLAFLLVLLALSAALLLPLRTQAAPAAALTIPVDTTTDSNAAGFAICDANAHNFNCSLRGAISKANADTANLYTIIVPAGTYTLTIVSTNEDANADGDLDITRGMTITGTGAASTIINGNGVTILDRVIDILAGAGSVSISGITIKNGKLLGAGAGIRNSATLNLSNCTVANNSSTGNAGGGIDNEDNRSAIINNCIISNNSASSMGGGIYNGGNLTISNSTINGNNVADNGGGIENNNLAQLTINNGTISGNTATVQGGGIRNRNQLTLIESTVLQNDAPDGGGIYSQNDITITNSSIISNTASIAAGMHITGTATADIVNSTISGNSATGGAGGIAINSPATLNLRSATIANNTAFVGGGLNIQAGATVNLRNTIVGGNIATFSVGYNCFGTLTSVNYSFIGDTSGCTVPAGTGNITNTSALLTALANNGGATLTHAFPSTSPVVNAGDPAGCTDQSSALLTTDQRGFLRHIGRCDMGALEYQLRIFLPLIVR